jgi:hypothetical protein
VDLVQILQRGTVALRVEKKKEYLHSTQYSTIRLPYLGSGVYLCHERRTKDGSR